MNTKRDANNLFMIVVLVAFLTEIAVSALAVKQIQMPMMLNLLVSQMIILLPGLIFFIVKNKEEEVYRPYKKIKPVTVLLLIVLTWLLMPLVTCANAFSQLFTSNEMVNVSGDLMKMPFLLCVLIVGIFGPFSEEFVFRGLIYNGLKGNSERYIASALISGLFFGLMHMNFNQFCYAFVLGFAFAIINECLDSTWASFICHAVVNTQNVILMYIMDLLFKKTAGIGIGDYYGQMSGAEDGNMKLVIIIMMLFIGAIAVGTTALAGLLLYGICKIEGKTDRFNMVLRPKRYREMTGGKENTVETFCNVEETGVEKSCNVEETGVKKSREKLLYPFGYAAIILCLIVMFLIEPLMNLLN